MSTTDPKLFRPQVTEKYLIFNLTLEFHQREGHISDIPDEINGPAG
jgi:hypothetical protein